MTRKTRRGAGFGPQAPRPRPARRRAEAVFSLWLSPQLATPTGVRSHGLRHAIAMEIS